MSKNHSHTRKKLPHHVIVRAPGLLPMLYKVRELASELIVLERTLRDWLVCGVPYLPDKNNHIWVKREILTLGQYINPIHETTIISQLKRRRML